MRTFTISYSYSTNRSGMRLPHRVILPGDSRSREAPSLTIQGQVCTHGAEGVGRGGEDHWGLLGGSGSRIRSMSMIRGNIRRKLVQMPD